MQKQEIIEDIAKLVCGACEMGLGSDGDDCAEGSDYRRCGISMDVAKNIYDLIFKKEGK